MEELVGMPVDSDQPLMEAGLDSIGSVELRNLVWQPLKQSCCFVRCVCVIGSA